MHANVTSSLGCSSQIPKRFQSRTGIWFPLNKSTSTPSGRNSNISVSEGKLVLEAKNLESQSTSSLTVKSGVGAVHHECLHVRLPEVVPLLVAVTFSLEYFGTPGCVLFVGVEPGGKRGEEDCCGEASEPHDDGEVRWGWKLWWMIKENQHFERVFLWALSVKFRNVSEHATLSPNVSDTIFFIRLLIYTLATYCNGKFWPYTKMGNDVVLTAW